jgi:hypothetical protein
MATFRMFIGVFIGWSKSSYYFYFKKLTATVCIQLAGSNPRLTILKPISASLIIVQEDPARFNG